jgi:hypothetical protein
MDLQVIYLARLLQQLELPVPSVLGLAVKGEAVLFDAGIAVLGQAPTSMLACSS